MNTRAAAAERLGINLFRVLLFWQQVTIVNDNIWESEVRTKKWNKNKMESDKKGIMQEISQFAMKSPELYRQYKERYDKEQDEERALHNRRLTENTFKNKPYSIR